MPQEEPHGSQSHYSDILETYNYQALVVSVQVQEHGPGSSEIYDSYDDGDGGNGEGGMEKMRAGQEHRAHLTESGEGRRTGWSVLPGQMWYGWGQGLIGKKSLLWFVPAGAASAEMAGDCLPLEQLRFEPRLVDLPLIPPGLLVL